MIEEAVEFTNESIKEVVFDPALIKVNIVQDVMALTAYADGEFTREELDKINKLLAEFGYELPEGIAMRFWVILKQHDSSLPKRWWCSN